ncbi:MAG: hypothetical protein HYV03_08870 [Deltaproteobacteria bacterium]|nr:hypothetical protein [Deltaproteobacteria bacterium]
MRRGLLFLSCLISLSLSAMASDRGPSGADSMAKASAPLRAAWQTETSRRARRQLIECFVKIDRGFTETERSELGRVGLKIRSVISQESDLNRIPGAKPSTILTGRIRLRNLARLAAVDYVRSIEGAVPVGQKHPEVLK